MKYLENNKITGTDPKIKIDKKGCDQIKVKFIN